MPRRNNRIRRRNVAGWETPEPELTYEQIAHDLVRRGLASRDILERPGRGRRDHKACTVQTTSPVVVYLPPAPPPPVARVRAREERRETGSAWSA